MGTGEERKGEPTELPEVHVGTASEFIALRPLRRVYPDDNDFFEANVLSTDVELRVRPFVATYRGQFWADEFSAFRKEVQALYRRGRGRAEFKPMEPWLSLTLELDPLGHLAVAGTAEPEVDGIFGRNRFAFQLVELDQTFLPPLLRQLEDVERVFPTIGQR